MTELGTKTNRQLLTDYTKSVERQMVINIQMIADGFGGLRPSDMRAKPDIHPLAREMLASFDECRALGIEADRRYGPGLIDVAHLVAALGPGYRRIKEVRNG